MFLIAREGETTMCITLIESPPPCNARGRGRAEKERRWSGNWMWEGEGQAVWMNTRLYMRPSPGSSGGEETCRWEEEEAGQKKLEAGKAAAHTTRPAQRLALLARTVDHTRGRPSLSSLLVGVLPEDDHRTESSLHFSRCTVNLLVVVEQAGCDTERSVCSILAR